MKTNKKDTNSPNFKILVIEDEPAIRQIYSIIIENRFDLPVVEAESEDQAIYFLKNDPHIKLILSDYHLLSGNGGSVYKFNLKNNNIPFILTSSDSISDHEEFSNFKNDNKHNVDIGKNFEHKDLIDIISKIYNETKGEKIKDRLEQEGTYYRVKIERYPELKDLKCSVFLKVENDNYMKILSIDNTMSEETFKSYTDMMVKYFYLDHKSFESYTKKIFDDYSKMLKDNHLKLNDKIKIQKESVFELQEVVNSMGISDFIIKFTDNVINSITATVSHNQNLREYIKSSINEDDYLKNHTMLMNYTISTLIHNIDEIDNANIDKFLYASLFCDIGLNNKALALIQGRNDPLFSKLTEEEKTDVLNHPAISSEILKTERKDLNDVRLMIRAQHATPDGNHTLNQAIFMLSHDFSHLVIQHKATQKKKIQSLLAALRRTHTLGHFEKPYYTLTSLLRK